MNSFLNNKQKPKMMMKRKALTALSVLALASTQVAPAQAQLATKHYLPPVVSYIDSDIVVEISTPSGAPVDYTIRSRDGGLRSDNMSIPAITGSVVRGTPVTHTFTRDGDNSDSSGGLGRTTTQSASILDDLGIIVEAEVAVTVIVTSLRSNNRSIISSKGDNGLGTEFFAWSAANTRGEPVSANGQSSNFFSIMATEDDTQVTVEGDNIFDGFDATSGVPITLQAGQTITISTLNNVSITGTHITSNHPITVTTGDVHPQQPSEGERDGGVDQLVPTRLAGTHYVLGNIFDSKQYGDLDAAGIAMGNRYVQLVAVADNTKIEHFQAADPQNPLEYDLPNAGDTLVLHLPGSTGSGHYFRSVGIGTEPFLTFLNTSGEPADEMGGAAVPALRGKNSNGSFCSGTEFVELTVPADTTAFVLYVPTKDLGSLQVDIDGTPKNYDDVTLPVQPTTTTIDPDGAGTEIDEITIIHYDVRSVPLAPDGERITFTSNGRMHVSVGTAVSNATGSFGYFSDFNYAFHIQDPDLHLPTDSYVEPLTFNDAKPRAVTHCIDVASVCSEFFGITAISSDRGGALTNVTTSSSVPGAQPCFDFTPVPVPGLGPQRYTVSATIIDENSDLRDVDIFFTFTWLDDESDGIPDGIDADDDNDGILDVDELGGVDLSGDSDLDLVPDYKDPDFVTCASTAGVCNEVPSQFDVDGDGIPNHLDLDSDGDGVWDIIEGNDANQDGINDNTSVADLDSDGRIDAALDVDQNGVDDSYDSVGAAKQNSDGDPAPDYLDTDDDNDGVLTRFEDYNGSGAQDDDTDLDGTPDYLDTDDDDDGVPTRAESPDPNGDGDPSDAVNSDMSGAPDYLDDAIVGPGDQDGDGRLDDTEDSDDDNDGILDAHELGGTDLSRDTDDDGISDYEDEDFVTCAATGGRCDVLPLSVDQDQDGIPNHLDTDSDGDGVFDLIEGNDANQDGSNDASVLDSNNDGVIDSLSDINQNGVDDAYDGSVSARQDTDDDGAPDFLDPDDDGDGLDTSKEDYNGNGPADDDTDSDNLPDYLDSDDDGDGKETVDEAPDPNGDGDPDDARDSDGQGPPDYLDGTPLGPTDSDGDGTPDSIDVDDDNDGIPDSIEGDVDTDGDGIIDALDLDSDNDGIPDLHEIGLGALDQDRDGAIDDRSDGNGDGSPDAADGALSELDTDDDGMPDRIDLDSDADGLPDILEAGAGSFDADGDGVVDDDADADGDGLADSFDPDQGGELPPIPDTDGDGTPDFQDTDSDDDGIADSIEGHDQNGDGIADVVPTGADEDGDGIDDAFDVDDGADSASPPDRDSDGTPDFLDPDDDNDGVNTVDENTDSDGDGVPDYLETDEDGDVTRSDPTGDGEPSLSAGLSLEGGGFSCSTTSAGGNQGGSLAALLALLLGGGLLSRRRRGAGRD